MLLPVPFRVSNLFNNAMTTTISCQTIAALVTAAAAVVVIVAVVQLLALEEALTSNVAKL